MKIDDDLRMTYIINKIRKIFEQFALQKNFTKKI